MRLRIPPARRSRHQAGKMNKLEADYAQWLSLQKIQGDVVDFHFESFKLRLADRTWYTPDFLVIYDDHMEFDEVKGFWEDDARVKWKTCADLYPWFTFKAIQKVKGEWRVEIYGGGHVVKYGFEST